MSDESRDYYLERAKQERAKAEALPANTPAAIAHRQMAEQYERRAHQEVKPRMTM